MSVVLEGPAGVAIAPQPPLPSPRGPLSEEMLDVLRGGPWVCRWDVTGCDPFGEDVQLALYVAYELHYRGFAGTDPDLEWDLEVLARRRTLEELFLSALRERVGPCDRPHALAVEVESLLEPPSDTGAAAYLLRNPDRDRLRELVVHRSLYHLKEADPQAFVLPRLQGAAKALIAAVEFDEYGAGRPERAHWALFAKLMRQLDLDDTYGAYLDTTPAPMLAIVNWMSMCGLHRRLRGALVGQLAGVELTSPLTSRRMAEVVVAHGYPPETASFYAEHVVADAVHERVTREAIAAAVAAEPELAGDVVLGIRAAALLDDRLEASLLECWEGGRSSLRRPDRTHASMCPRPGHLPGLRPADTLPL
jgi:hypothetical protein